LHDVLIVCDDEREARAKSNASGLLPGVIRPNTAVVDLTADFRLNDILREAQARGCLFVHPRDVFIQQLQLQTKLLTGEDAAGGVFQAAFPEWALYDE
jgi:hypothetical protein